MLKMLFAVAVIVAVIVVAAQFMKAHHSNVPVPGPVVVKVSVPNPLGGSNPQNGGGGGQIYVP
jgi:hypothetical protein